MPNVRLIAIHVLESWEEGHAYAHELVDRQSAYHRLESRDTALLLNIVFTTLRNIQLLDGWIAKMTDGKELESSVQWMLRSSLTQLALLGMPEHAVVNESVAIAGHAKGLINAILRRTLRESDHWSKWVNEQPLSIRYSQPNWLLKRWRAQFGEDVLIPWCQWNQAPAELFFRVNTLNSESPSKEELESFEPTSNPLFYKTKQVPREWLMQGKVYVQDLSTAMACELTDPQPNERILDACAAPGGKTSYLAQMMNNQGEIVACDSQPKRLEKLSQNLDRLRVTNTKVVYQDWAAELSPDFQPASFDRILLDVPCSNTGVMKRRVDVRWRLRPGDFKQLTELQFKITEATVPLLKVGGSLIYSSCSMDKWENEAAIERIVAHFPQLQLQESKTLLPWKDQTDGAFAAKFLLTAPVA